jgi:hypothetical protein
VTHGELTKQRQQAEHRGNGQAQLLREADESNLTARHDFHLLGADAAIPDCYEVLQTWVTLCGRKLTTRELPSSMCPPDCQREITYCPECLRVAIERNDEAGALPEVLGTRLG